jgi:hypothetical protein
MFTSLMDKSVSVQRETKGQDASGATTRASFASVATAVQCAIQSASSRQVDDYARRNIRITNVIYSEYDFDANLSGGLKLGDQIVDGSTVYVVKTVDQDRNANLSPTPLYKITCERLSS